MTPRGASILRMVCRSLPPIFNGLLISLFSSGPKQLLVVAYYVGFRLTFHPQGVYMGGSRMPVH